MLHIGSNDCQAIYAGKDTLVAIMDQNVAPTTNNTIMNTTTKQSTLQVKPSGKDWTTVVKHSDPDYLKTLGDKHFSRFAKRRVVLS